MVVARFNPEVTGPLARGARAALVRCGAARDAVRVIEVPGAWELGAVVAAIAAGGRYRAIVACAAIIRGETAHFEHIARGCTDALARAQAETGVPVGMAVLTTNTLQQALARAGGEAGNKGEEAAFAAVETANVLAELGR